MSSVLTVKFHSPRMTAYGVLVLEFPGVARSFATLTKPRSSLDPMLMYNYNAAIAALVCMDMKSWEI